MNGFLSHFVTRPVFVLMVTITILVVGTIAVTRLPLQLLPEGMSGDTVNMGVDCQGMTPDEVEEQVYAPLEGELRTIPGVREVNGRCGAGSLRCWVEFSPNLDPRIASAEVRDRIQRARLTWPPECDRYWTWRESTDSMPLMFFSLTLPDRSPETYEVIERKVVPTLEGLSGVGEVRIFGMVDDSIRIFFDRQKLRAHRVNLQEVLQRLRDDNVSIPVGDVDDGERRFLVRADLRYRTLDSIRAIPIGDGLLLSDVATVERVRGYRDSIARANGRYSFTGLINKRASANTIEASKEVRAAIARLQSEDPRLAQLEPVWMFDQGEFIEESVDTLLTSAVQGGVLAFAVLLLFLRRLKMTLAITLSLPLSLLVATAVVFFGGGSLNLLSMAALTISLGMLVDNSVVVLENIYRRRRLGESWVVACKVGVSEVGTAVALATLTSVVVFVPVLFAGDSPSAKAMLGAFGIPLCAALLASLFVALILLPSMTAWLHRDTESLVDRESRIVRAHRWLGAHMVTKPLALLITPFVKLTTLEPVAAYTRVQERIVAWSTRGWRRLVTALVIFVFVVGGILVATKGLERGVGGGDRRGQVTIEWDFPKGTSLAEADQQTLWYEKWLDERRNEYGIANISARLDRQDARINLGFPPGTPGTKAKEAIARLRKDLPPRPGIKPEVHSRISSGDEAIEGDNGFMVQLSGRDSESLRDWAQDVGERLLDAKLAAAIDLGNTNAQDELRLEVDRGRVQELGVDPRTLFGIVSAGLRGQQISRIRQPGGQDLRLIAEYSDSQAMRLEDLQELQIWSRDTGFQRLEDMAEFHFAKGYASILRTNGVLTSRVGGERAPGVTPAEFATGLTRIMSTMPRPPGYRYQIGGDARKANEDMAAMLDAAILAVVLVMLVMGILFESVLLPIAAGATLPVALSGSFFGMIAFGRMFDPTAIIGLMILAGVVVNNGIVLLDHVVRLRGEGLERAEAIQQGIRDRMRPILMTAATTIVGLLPMMFTDVASERGISYDGMATIVASGLFLGTFFTPVIVPVTYTILEDVRAFFSRVWQGSRPRTDDVTTISCRSLREA
ncbi:MAG: efflux RND transporter permease subunit [Planctomycetes bacterium]|nr:efflux RND transporter permease subunit [Planctomycetota bacterium]MCB9918414.1 efflux RND transporter permease subunit [Planctomycetota bacterium]